MSDSNSSIDEIGFPKCQTPPKHLKKFIDKKIKIASDERNSSSDDDSDMNYNDEIDESSSRSASPRRATVEFNRFGAYDKSDDEDDDYRTEIAHSQQITLKISYCSWTISDFSTSNLNKLGYINSKVYTAGISNEIQWYFRVERFRQKTEVFYGVYARNITFDESDANIEYRGYITELRGHSYRLDSSSTFPRKKGYQFLGYLRKSKIRDDDYWVHRYLPEDRLTLSFRIHLQYKKYNNQLVNELKMLWKNKKFSDFTLIVKQKRYPVHKSILAARSSIFAELFDKESDKCEMTLNEYKPEMIEEFLRFLYTGKLKKLTKFIKEYTDVANEFKIKELQSICEKASDFLPKDE